MITVNKINKNAILVYVVLSKSEDIPWNIKELLDLAYSSDIQVLDTLLVKNLRIVNSKYFISKGKILELESKIKENLASVVLFSCILSPNQERNLVKLFGCKVIDRNQLILNIFADRARTYEGKLQVQLAQLRYLNSRLTHEWNHLERQKGGIGVRGGPGEMQLENDRRLLSKRIFRVLSDLKKIENQRKQNRRHRVKIGIPTISLVGYTNVGKSTLFNIMTSAHVDTAKKLFVTLDPTFRRIGKRKKSSAILVDTVGFIQNLPKDLITSFKSTLQETVESTLLLHVVDVSSNKINQHIKTVNDILREINIKNIPVLLIMNKIDLIDKIEPHIDRNFDGRPIRVWLSAHNRVGIDLLNKAIDELLPNNMVSYKLMVPINSSLYQKLYKLQAVTRFYHGNENMAKLKVDLSFEDWNYLTKCHGSLHDYIV
ncbi:GTP-binding protein [Candidatus Blochmanniella vafra str. BVAF]|uniref:GTPase HflX n=1 Tax=Blochmanniella vafra (strain BVAF) TaxID=859654 RepID=E8Q6P8_BLOVB|nr:ribosome rescue GTPase HflX [Candidatus Blochmannia vafer]ADV33489.1 GTP-binding protein [Candidatus Blochmannia vafer str. BVAF]